MRATYMNLSRVSTLSDLKGVVTALNVSNDWFIIAIVLDILNLSSGFILRRLNKMVPILAKVYYSVGRDVIHL